MSATISNPHEDSDLEFVLDVWADDGGALPTGPQLPSGSETAQATPPKGSSSKGGESKSPNLRKVLNNPYVTALIIDAFKVLAAFGFGATLN